MIPNQGRDLVTRVTIACAVLETVAVCLRLLARCLSETSLAVDDWWIVASLVPSYAMLANGMIMVTLGGGGLRGATLTPSELKIFLTTVSTGLVTYSLTITMVKISILLLYRRVFDTRIFKKATLGLGIICVCWGIVAILCLIFQCHPISGMWNPADTFTDKCIDLKAYYTGLASSNMIIDIVILSMPVYMVWGLNLPLGKKLGLSGIFLLGGLVCVASLLRILTIKLIKGVDLPYTVITPYIWSQIEPTTAIICACLITYRPLLSNLKIRSLSNLSWNRRSRSLQRWSDLAVEGDAPGKKWPRQRLSNEQELRRFQALNSRTTNGGLQVITALPPIDRSRSELEEFHFAITPARSENSFV